VLPHFDKMLGWIPDLLTRPFLPVRSGVTLVGVDEETALVGGPDLFEVQGHQSAWVLSDGRRRELTVGQTLQI
jgi:hypothetical protein